MSAGWLEDGVSELPRKVSRWLAGRMGVSELPRKVSAGWLKGWGSQSPPRLASRWLAEGRGLRAPQRRCPSGWLKGRGLRAPQGGVLLAGWKDGGLRLPREGVPLAGWLAGLWSTVPSQESWGPSSQCPWRSARARPGTQVTHPAAVRAVAAPTFPAPACCLALDPAVRSLQRLARGGCSSCAPLRAARGCCASRVKPGEPLLLKWHCLVVLLKQHFLC